MSSCRATNANSFFAWCVDEHILREEDVPQWPRLSKKALGTRSGPRNAIPKSVGSAARFLAVLRTTDEALETALATELLGGQS